MTIIKPPDLAYFPDILEESTYVFQKLGLIGEERNAKILLLCTVTRLLPRPVSVIVKGVSGGGKSHTVETVLRLVPKTAYIARTAMSEKALLYSEEPLKNRHLVFYEAVGMGSGFGSYVVRSLLSENKLSYEVTEKGKTRLIEKEGPTGVFITTTEISIHPDNETRLLSLTAKDSPEQTHRIMLAMAEEEQENFDFTEWHALQEYIAASDNRVTIPYANALALLIPPKSVRLRRDIRQVLSLIKAHAILHQMSRKRDDRGRIIAHLDDYAAVYNLVADIISHGIETTVPPEVLEAVDAVRVLAMKYSNGVSYKAVGDHLKLDKSTAKRRCDDAIGRGYLRKDQTRRNQPAQLMLDEPMPVDTDILPAPDVLNAAFTASLGNGFTVARENGRAA